MAYTCLDIILLRGVLPRAAVYWFLQVPVCGFPRVGELFLHSWNTHRNYFMHEGSALDVSLLIGVEQIPFFHGQMCQSHACSPVIDHHHPVVEHDL